MKERMAVLMKRLFTQNIQEPQTGLYFMMKMALYYLGWRILYKNARKNDEESIDWVSKDEAEQKGL
jgi:hypothetical protein